MGTFVCGVERAQGQAVCLVATGQKAAGQLSCQCCQLLQVVLVSAHRLWKDLQAFCCSQGKCNFHDNSNLNCTLKVRGAGAPRGVPSGTCLAQGGPTVP